jgi:hypothetical protein
VKLCHPLHVDESIKADGSLKLRVCNDVRFLNGHQAHMRFQMEPADKSVPAIVEPGDLMAFADVESAYYAVWMHTSAWPYQGFRLRDQYFQGRVLLFGGSQAPWVFTKINRPSLAFFRALLLKVTNFIDDWLAAANAAAPRRTIEFVAWVLVRLGWSLSTKKCVLDPVKVILYLGMLVDSRVRIPRPGPEGGPGSCVSAGDAGACSGGHPHFLQGHSPADRPGVVLLRGHPRRVRVDEIAVCHSPRGG